MPDKITWDQYQELMDVIDGRNAKEVVKTFEKLTGIEVRPYTAYQFFDAGGTYLGDSEYDTLRAILLDAGIEVTD